MKTPEIIQRNVSLKKYNSWEVGGEAEAFALPKTTEELIVALDWARAEGLVTTVLGGGTNVLISDRGIPGLTIGLRRLAGTQVQESQGRLVIQSLAGTSKSELLKIFLKHKLAPALMLAGLPGDVGGGVVMNAGVSENLVPREFCELVDWIEVLNEGRIRKISGSDLSWSYRHCDGWRPGVIVRVGLSWPLEPQGDILNRVKEANQNRLQKQPLEWPSCGSVFVNPPGQKSGSLIEQCGLKGFCLGGAEVSTKHANFIINRGEATADQIDQVIRYVQKVVADKTGHQLHTEVVYLGTW